MVKVKLFICNLDTANVRASCEGYRRSGDLVNLCTQSGPCSIRGVLDLEGEFEVTPVGVKEKPETENLVGFPAEGNS